MAIERRNLGRSEKVYTRNVAPAASEERDVGAFPRYLRKAGLAGLSGISGEALSGVFLLQSRLVEICPGQQTAKVQKEISQLTVDTQVT